MPVSVKVLLGRPVGVRLPGQDFSDVLHVGVEVFGCGQFLPRHMEEGLRVVAEEIAQGVVELREATIRAEQGHTDGGALDGLAVTRFGRCEALLGFESLADVAPGQDDVIASGPGGPKVVAAGVLENFVVVGEVVEYQRLTGLQTPDEIGEQRFFDTRHGVQHSATDQVATRHVEVVARRLVDVPVAEIDDLAGGVPHRFQEHARVE